MSSESENERIDLTQDELRDKLYDWMTKGYEPQMAVSDDIPNEISEILFAIEHLGLIAELKKCYEKLDMAESALTEIWAHQIDNVGGYNVTEILLYYEKTYGLNIKPEASE